MTDLSESPLQLESLGPYQLVRELGRNREGGRITYLAISKDTSDRVVLKQFRFVQFQSSWSGYKSYEREIEILQSINHPQVPRYLSSFETEDGFCMVQEYKDAPSLAQCPYLTPPQIELVARSLLSLLADLQAHVPPLIHRDIKPENVLVDETLQVFLIDFGLAKLNHDAIALSSVASGTPGFIPPEELFNRPLDTAADLYSVGATLLSLLAHIPSAHISELLDQSYRFQIRAALPPLNPQWIEWLETLVEPNPRDRFRDAATALQALNPLNITDLTPLDSKSASDPHHAQVKDIKAKLLLFSLLGPLMMGVLFFFSLIKSAQIPKSSPFSADLTKISPRIESLSPETQWFESIKPQCNALEVRTAIETTPPPPSSTGVGLKASCYTLAGKLTFADEAIQSLPEPQQIYAAQILFETGHPVADRGDDESAGPIMELVLKYWPDNYMARYHAGMSAYSLNKHEKAVEHLQAFLNQYHIEDGWHQKAQLALRHIEQGIPADPQFKGHE